jgi:hypothetical protein
VACSGVVMVLMVQEARPASQAGTHPASHFKSSARAALYPGLAAGEELASRQLERDLKV